MRQQKLENFTGPSPLDVGSVSLVGVNLHGRVMLSTTLTSGAPTVKSCHQGSNREEEPTEISVSFLNHLCGFLPFEGCKHVTSNSRSARSPPVSSSPGATSNVRQQHSQRNETCKPEEHRENLGSQDSELVCGGRVSCRRDDQVDESENCPDGRKDQEVDLGR
jgi:hypothetical protein